MIKKEAVVKGFKTPEARWARLGPYYAMFPLEFAFDVVNKYSNKGDYIIDPFAGRGSSIFAGGVLGRQSLGIEINPVGWLYGSVKLNPANKEDVLNRLNDIYSMRDDFSCSIEKMPIFYRMCYCDEVLKFLLSARSNLKWKENNTDASLISILLVYLHGKLGEALSNQLKMTKALGMNYSVNWWKNKNLTKPPEINPFEFIKKKIEWRYEKGKPEVFNSHIICGDSTIELKSIVREMKDKKYSLLFTSPPYCSVTDYYADQWLRIWLLGGSESLQPTKEKHKNRFVSKEDYYSLLDNVFSSCSEIMDDKSIVYVRIDSREFTFNTTFKILRKHFPKHKYKIINQPYNDKRTQTKILGNSSKNSGEKDIILSRS